MRCVALVVACGLSAPIAARAETAYFQTDVVPLLTKLGCNGGGCHGKATGQNGFRLSLLGYEADVDHEAIVNEARGRRISLSAPQHSLLLLKATGTVPHGGGRRLEVGSEDYRVLFRWIERGAPPASSADPVLQRITVTPAQRTFDVDTRRQMLKVVGHFSDGATRDLTRRAVYQSNEPELADVTDAGVVDVKGRSGLFAVMVRYGEQIGVFHGTVPSRPTQP